jgi:hypothetical protein
MRRKAGVSRLSLVNDGMNESEWGDVCTDDAKRGVWRASAYFPQGLYSSFE